MKNLIAAVIVAGSTTVAQAKDFICYELDGAEPLYMIVVGELYFIKTGLALTLEEDCKRFERHCGAEAKYSQMYEGDKESFLMFIEDPSYREPLRYKSDLF